MGSPLFGVVDDSCANASSTIFFDRAVFCWPCCPGISGGGRGTYFSILGATCGHPQAHRKEIITEFSEELFKTPHVSGGGPNCTGGTQYEDVTGKKLKFATKTLHRLIPVLNNGTTVTSFYSNVVCPSSNRGGVST